MNPAQFFAMTALMESHGGTFVSCISQALRYADPVNRQRLLDAFPDLVEKYGPNSQFMKPKELMEV
jgi:2-oxo-4-hydroxy-4-carboxy--5-ureidoimidazoline (OHCU) decarboxylase